uniref:Reverse transcriptase domain-containing protein n=1 Tax=Leptobrachium leishanense TaxID=445787 RepID=A0A8C5M042_9ANUR
MVKGTIGTTRVTLVNVYLPNRLQTRAFRKILDKLTTFLDGMLIMGGDCNVALDLPAGGLAGATTSAGSLRRQFQKLLGDERLFDCWRTLNPSDKDYTYYSHAFSRYSRIDYFFLPHRYLDRIRRCWIGPITWSDHAPVIMHLTLPQSFKGTSHWRLNDTLLSDVIYRSELQSALTRFFEENESPDIKPTILWETHKCVARGVLIQMGARKKRERDVRVTQLLSDIRDLERVHKEDLDPQSFRSLVLLRAELNKILNDQASRSITLTNQTYYSQGNKCGKLLARALKNRHQTTFIPKIRRGGGRPMAYTTGDIASEFHQYYSTLYNNRPDIAPPTVIDSFLAKTIGPTLARNHRTLLDSPITAAELKQALKLTPHGKSPGPDGFTTLYYKTFQNILTPFFVQAFNSVDEETRLPRDTMAASIAIIPKPGKDPLDCENYRPISLLNTDLKLFTKILALRLRPLLGGLIHADQAGFVPRREARDNTLRALSALHGALVSSTPMLVLSVDAEKAFDRVNWQYLFAVLHTMGFGPRWCQWMAALYGEPHARIRVNGTLSDSITIRNGTRQGCPLSPLLFLLYLEPLLQEIRRSQDIKGLRLDGQEYKVSAYADDLLFTLTDVDRSLPSLMRVLTEFANISDYKINPTKSEFMGPLIPNGSLVSIQETYGFKWKPEGLTYLGIKLATTQSQLIALNYDPLLRSVTEDLQKWNLPHISWLGRLNVLKMNILPRFLYLFQALPIFLPRSFFISLRTQITRYIWRGKRARISFAEMARPVGRGGLGMPHFQYYYLASMFSILYHFSKPTAHRRWIEILQATSGFPLASLPWQTASLQALGLANHPILTPILKLWRKHGLELGLTAESSPLTPVTHNPLFPPGITGELLGLGREMPYLPVNQIVENGALLPLNVLISPTQSTFAHAFNYTQLRHFFHSDLREAAAGRTLTPFESICSATRGTESIVSVIQTYLTEGGYSSDSPRLAKWEEELGRDIDPQEWYKAFLLTFYASRSMTIREQNCKLFLRWYMTPAQLHRISPSEPASCWRCLGDKGDYLHIWWSCPRLRSYWGEVAAHIKEITGSDLTFEPASYLLNMLQYSTDTFKNSLLAILLSAARGTIPMYWRQRVIPTVRDWVTRVEKIRGFEDLHYTAQGKYDLFYAVWWPWIDRLPALAEGAGVVEATDV